jgi:uncharacterized protein
MPQVTRYRHGVPSWVDVSTSHLAATSAFYSNLFGWESDDQGEEAGHYTMFTKDGLNAAGMGPIMNPATPAAWTTYLTVDDCDATLAAVAANGGTVLMATMDVLTSGRMGVATDPDGAVIAFWQPIDHIGCSVVNEPGALVWNELATRNSPACRDFYAAVAGWTFTPMEGMDSYHLVELNGHTIGGIMAIDGATWDGIPSHWAVYFAVTDCDASAAKATELGGTVVVPPNDMGVGRFATITDPTGATFAIIQLHQIDEPVRDWKA